MEWNKLMKEMNDYIKGIISALIVAVLWSLIQYVGAHIPEILQWISSALAATSTIKLTRK